MANLWSANSGMDVENVWDDTALIEMYDQALQETKRSIGIREKEYVSDDGTKYTWKVGGKCMAPFEEKGETSYYAATIDSIGGKDNLEVGVTFLYYGNQTVAHMKDLWIDEKAIAEAIASEQEEAGRIKKEVTNTSSTSVSNSSNKNSSVPLPAFAPPVPPSIIAMAPADQKEAMNSMLMSWYMSGYHTGYYQAMADQKAKK